MLTIGVEEELQIVDADTYDLYNGIETLLEAARPVLRDRVATEIHRSQIEVRTPICTTLPETRAAIVSMRQAVGQAAAAHAMRVISAGSHPFAHWTQQEQTPYARYEMLFRLYGQLAQQQMIFGCHVHVGLPDPAQGIEVLNRVRRWLAPLLALSANSPFWMGSDTSHASYRAVHWGRWPLAGPPPHMASAADYDELINHLIATGTIDDGTRLYWDARVHPRYHTLEFRIADACLTVDDTLMIAGLARALVQTCARNAANETPYPVVQQTVLRVAHWYAARYGVGDQLIDVTTGQRRPASEIIAQLLAFLHPALQENNDWNTVYSLVTQTLVRGTGAERQRQVYAETDSLREVAAFLAAETARTWR
jgi:carboxylate-amine ligase